jgi:hypothetical protein
VRVVMTVDQSGMRNGQDWPPRGTVIDLPDAEALGYIRGGMARPADPEDDVEKAVAPTVDVETRGGLTKKTGPAKK